jgi:hypothetical protein
MGSKPIYRTANASRPTVVDMRIDHRSLDVAIAQEFLEGSNVITAFEQVGGKGMPEGAASGPLGRGNLRASKRGPTSEEVYGAGYNESSCLYRKIKE